MKYLILFLSFLTLNSCIEGDGKFDVYQNLVLKDKKSNEILLSPGAYRAQIIVKNKKMTLKIPGKKKINFEIPKDVYVPEQNGSFELPSTLTGQNYDLVGDIQTTYDRGEDFYGVESCSHYRSYRRCTRNSRNQIVWISQSALLRGEQDISYHNESKNTDFVLELLELLTGNSVAQYSMNQTLHYRVVDYRSSCRIWGYEEDRYWRIVRSARRCPPPHRTPPPTPPRKRN
ncbi:MAG: hypothetical protein H6621_02305 [Halobacteriovoraceae bacterium]|nr:hypothetical protein [Halobacteriovoraceae bacterium]MCB9093876.1 hypothetical protein [Halobacteriovoraceae bacterium]